MARLELQGFQTQNAPFSYWILLRNGPVGAPELPGSECSIFLLDSIEKWPSFELQSFQAQNAPFSYWILLRNGSVGAPELPGSEWFIS